VLGLTKGREGEIRVRHGGEGQGRMAEERGKQIGTGQGSRSVEGERARKRLHTLNNAYARSVRLSQLHCIVEAEEAVWVGRPPSRHSHD
jgi:hypothetical protein